MHKYTDHEVRAHKHTDSLLSGGLSRCNRIHFVTRLVNDSKLDFMHAFILIHPLTFFIWAVKTRRTIETYPIPQLGSQTGPGEGGGIYSFSFD